MKDWKAASTSPLLTYTQISVAWCQTATASV